MPWKPLELPSDREISAFADRFRKKARLLVDESLGPTVAEVLRHAGWNAKFVDEVGLKGHDDSDVFAFAQHDDRILLTHDEDFLDDRRFPPHRNPGVVRLPGAEGEEEPLGRALAIMTSVVAPYRENWRGTKISISKDGTIAITNRNHDTGAMETTKYRWPRNGPVEILVKE